MNSKVIKIPAVLICAIAGLAFCEIDTQKGEIMSTYYMIKIEGEGSKKYIFDNAVSELKKSEKLFNDYSKKSEISQVNSTAYKNPIRITDDLAQVLRGALKISKESGGCFDPTVRPLVELWGFKSGLKEFPSPEEIDSTLSLIGWENLSLDANIVNFKKPGLSLDLGGIAKGYAVDRAVRALKDSSILNALVEVGGDIYCLGSGPDHKGWKIGIQHPKIKGAVIATVTASDIAVATSGNYEKFFVYQGKIYSHIIDPRSGYPAQSEILSATVLASSCMEADGWATAFFVMGLEPAKEFVELKDDLELILITETGQGIDIWVSSGLKGKVEIL
ncbi:MAG: FAD:protein FMN transferase [Candidatus Omnitrophica bacterium]|nr:FAD:protein FMN transferase [Candidatus Omnitrophota bacterium]